MNRKGAIPQFLQYAVIFLFGFLVFYIVATWLGSGYAAYQAIEESSLVYTLSSSANALSLMEEGYVRKELSTEYDIEIEKNMRDDRETNFYVKVTPSDVWSRKYFDFVYLDRECGTAAAPVITAEGRNIHFFGRVETEDRCYKLDAELRREGSSFEVIIHPKKDRSITDCDCTGSVKYSGDIKNLNLGEYTVTIIVDYEFRVQEPEVTLASEKVRITGGEKEDVKDDENKYFIMTSAVTPTILQNVDCIKIIKEPGENVTFEKCTKSTSEEYVPGGGEFGGGGTSGEW
jgi:hypothetical protein